MQKSVLGWWSLKDPTFLHYLPGTHFEQFPNEATVSSNPSIYCVRGYWVNYPKALLPDTDSKSTWPDFQSLPYFPLPFLPNPPLQPDSCTAQPRILFSFHKGTLATLPQPGRPYYLPLLSATCFSHPPSLAFWLWQLLCLPTPKWITISLDPTPFPSSSK